MDILNGNTIIFTDLHCGLSGNKLSKLKICINACKSIIETANNNNVKMTMSSVQMNLDLVEF